MRVAKRIIGLLMLALLLTACATGTEGGDEPGKNTSGGGGIGANPEAASDCLKKTAALSATSFPDPSSAVEAFAYATIICGATASQIKEKAKEMQRDGIGIEGSRQ